MYIGVPNPNILVPLEKMSIKNLDDGDEFEVLYNPASRTRPEHLKRACDIFLEYRPAETICGIARNIGREGQESLVMTLAELSGYPADMFTTVFIGNSETQLINGKMVTPRGYGNG